MDGVSGNEKVWLVALKETAVHGWAIGKQTATDGICASKDDHFRMGDGVITQLKGSRHGRGDGASDDDAVRMPRRCHELNPVSSHVEIHIATCVKLKFIAVVSARRHLT